MQGKIREFYQKLKEAADVPQPVFGVIENILASILNEAIDNNIPYFANLLREDMSEGYGRWIETVKERIEEESGVCCQAVAEETLQRIHGETWIPEPVFESVRGRLKKESARMYAGDVLAVIYQAVRAELPHSELIEALNRKHFAGIMRETAVILEEAGHEELLKKMRISERNILRQDAYEYSVRAESPAVHRLALEACIADYQKEVLAVKETNRNKREAVIGSLLTDLFENMTLIIGETIPDEFARKKWSVRMKAQLEEKRGKMTKPADFFRLSHGQYLYIRCGDGSYSDAEFLPAYEEMILMTELATDNESVHPETWRHTAKSRDYLTHYLAARTRLHEVVGKGKQDS
jgi:hypothetical protein